MSEREARPAPLAPARTPRPPMPRQAFRRAAPRCVPGQAWRALARRPAEEAALRMGGASDARAAPAGGMPRDAVRAAPRAGRAPGVPAAADARKAAWAPAATRRKSAARGAPP